MSNELLIPRALDGVQPLRFDMVEIRQAESRLGEVAMTNAIRAPELLALYNGAYLKCRRYINLLEHEAALAERRLDEASAVFIIDRLPGLLAEKGLATARSPLGSEDIRKAFLALDPDYKRFQDLLVTLRSYTALLETMETGFENAYNSVKKLIGTDQTNRPNPNLVQPLYDHQQFTGGQAVTITNTPKQSNTLEDDDFFGKVY